MWDFKFFFNSILLGFGLSMDAFSLSLANGLKEPKMNTRRTITIAGAFGLFQGIMPLIGWVCVHTILSYFTSFQKFIPWIALVLLLFIGGKMIIESIKAKPDDVSEKPLGFFTIILQAIATSIDALSVGFTIGEYRLINAVVSSLIIMAITFILCFFGVKIGKKFGTSLSNKAGLIGGIILVIIGIEIFLTGIL